jgi:hypothetical protein
MSQVIDAPAGTRGFDTNNITTPVVASFAKAGYRFAVRYIRRDPAHANDLSRSEIAALHRSGLAVMPVQHVESEDSWRPTDDKARRYGANAVDACRRLRVPAGVSVWLDLEGVAIDVDAEQIIRYCNRWFDIVAAAAFKPCVYVGWQSGLTPQQLRSRLKFTRYWAAYNLNLDEYPAVRGVCMRQRAARPGDVPNGVSLEIDTDTVQADALGGLPTMWAPAEWGIF